MTTTTVFALSLALAAPALQAQHEGCPHHAAPAPDAKHGEHVDARGDEVMGFSHEKTAHHFLLAKDGGSIEVTAIDAKDADSLAAIRRHLSSAVEAFRNGDFEMPHAVHGVVPPGVPALKTLKGAVEYVYEPLEGGGRVTLRTASREGITAIHEFLVFQIEEHRTGDPKTAP
ncbi:MAG TPA: hypothetical protein VKF32_05635 [Thermoanaerobaculia bacterium]|nr:hypothetical protein [Thermoanaerobaculia bacterium]